MVVIQKGKTQGRTRRVNTASCGNILEDMSSLIVKQQETVLNRHREIGASIIVIVAGGTSNSMQSRIESRLLRDVLESSFADVVKESHASLRTSVRKKEIWMTVIIDVDEARSRA